MSKIKKSPKSVRLSDSFEKQVDEYVAASEKSFNKITNLALAEYMANHPVKKPRPELEYKPGV